MPWQQIYDPFGNMIISTALAAIPVVVMLAALGLFHIKAHIAAGMGLIAALLVAVFAYGMPAEMAGRAAMLGGFTGLLPIGWIVLNIIFLHQLTEQNGSFKVLQDSLSGITEDRRIQLLLIAFCFGAFFEGAAGFGTPVAVTAAILIGLGFSPLAASGLSLIANTAPVAFGALGTPVITLAQVHGYDLHAVTAMIGRQLPFFSLLVPFWLLTDQRVGTLDHRSGAGQLALLHGKALAQVAHWLVCTPTVTHEALVQMDMPVNETGQYQQAFKINGFTGSNGIAVAADVADATFAHGDIQGLAIGINGIDELAVVHRSWPNS